MQVTLLEMLLYNSIHIEMLLYNSIHFIVCVCRPSGEMILVIYHQEIGDIKNTIPREAYTHYRCEIMFGTFTTLTLHRRF